MKLATQILIFLLTFPLVALASNETPKTTVPGLMEMIEDGSFELANPFAKAYQEMQILTIDTNNPEVCRNIRQKLYASGNLSQSDYRHLCDTNPKKPFVSVVTPSTYNGKIIRYSELSPKEKALAKQTRNYVPLMAGMMAVLYILPESATGWDRFEWEGLTDRWIENNNKGPKSDPDGGFFNYFAHPYVGAGYYQVARHEGFSPMASFAYSAFMSTVLWEFGIEAVSEVPSSQDLIITPVIGSLLGELFYNWSKQIEANGGKIMGLAGLGKFTQFVLHPAGTLLNASNYLFSEKVFEDADGYFFVDKNSSQRTRFNLGVRLWFKRH